VITQTLKTITLLTLCLVLAACRDELAPETTDDLNQDIPVAQATNQTALITPTLALTEPLQAPAAAPAETNQAAQIEAAQEPSALVPPPEVTPAPPLLSTVQYGLIAGQIDDRSINQLTWEGMQQAAQTLSLEVRHLESHEPAQIEANINQFLTEGYEGIVAVGSELAPFTQAASDANPNVSFINVDFPSQTAGDLGLLFATDQPAFMAGYLAAGMSQTGTVCTFGGRQLPPVMIFMVGFENGVAYYNQNYGTNVQLVGWQTEPAHELGGTGLFIGSFSNQEEGGRVAEELFNQGCDIIFPVAGAAGLGAARVAQARGMKVIGVDADMTQAAPEFAGVYLTSVLKRVDQAVFEAIRQIETEAGQQEESDFRDNYVGNLENGGVGLAPFHSYEEQIPQQLKDDLVQIRERLIAGTLPTGWPIGAAMAKIAGVDQAAPEAEVRTEAQLQFQPESETGVVSETAAGVTLEDLKNIEYQVDYTANGRARLVNGQFREPAAPGSATEVVIILSDVIAFGDLNGDGAGDAAAVLISDPGGSGTFYDLAIVIEQNGNPVNVATTLLGDRLIINALTIEGDEVVVDMVTQSPQDPLCCPSQQLTRRYKLESNLVELDALANASDYAGTYQASLPAAASPGLNLTLTLNPDSSAEMISDYLNGQPPIIESGTWSSTNGSVIVTLTSLNGRSQNNQISFELHESVLISTVYDVSLYGPEGLRLAKQE
jgi:basic membrane protein A